MKAQVLYGINDLRYVDKDLPEIKDGHVIVKVMAAGICGSDIPRIFYSGAHKMPLVPGHEFSGQVLTCDEIKELYNEHGSNEQIVWSGKRVGIFPLIPCKECGPCKNQHYEMCRNYNYLGSRCDGGFAEYVSVPVWNLIELPENVSFEEAAMLEPMAVAIHATRQAVKDLTNLKDKTVLICGLGTIGLMLLSFMIELVGDNSKIYAIGNKEFQKKKAVQIGLLENNYIDINADLSEKLGNANIDYYFECVGKNSTIAQGINIVRPGGFVQLVGNPVSDMNFPKDVYWKILRNQLTVKGTWNSSFTHNEDDDWHLVLKYLSEKKIKPEAFITHRFELSALMTGLNIMKDKTEEYIKVIQISE